MASRLLLFQKNLFFSFDSEYTQSESTSSISENPVGDPG